MSPFETYKTYLALKNHFTKDSYDFFKYAGKVSASVKSFEGRRDRFHFEKLSKHRDPTSFILANLVENPDLWIGDLVQNEESERRYRNWLKRTQSRTYTFRDELGQLESDFDSNFESEPGQHPPLLRKYLGNAISLDTLVILIHLTKCFGRWNGRMESDPVWRNVRRRIIKYQPFMKYDLAKFRSIVLEKFAENA